MNKYNMRTLLVATVFVVASVHLFDSDKTLATLILIFCVLVQILVAVSEINNKLK